MAKTLFWDDFTELYSEELNVRLPPVGDSYTKVFANGDEYDLEVFDDPYGLYANVSVYGWSNSGIIYSLDCSPSSADYWVETVVGEGPINSSPFYIMGRLTDVDNFYAVRISTGTDKVKLYKKVSGSFTLLDSGTTSLTSGDTIKLEMIGTNIKVYINGTEEISSTDSSLSSVGKPALGHGGGTELVHPGDDILGWDDRISFSIGAFENTTSYVYANGYSHRRKISINSDKVSGSSNLSDFTFCFAGTYTYLRDTGNSGDVISVFGNDIRFETENGTKLKHDLAYYNNIYGRIEAWVKIPTLLYNNSTEIYVYYGKIATSAEEDPTNAYSSDIDSVYHLNEVSDGTTDEFKDSKGTNHGTGGNGVSNESPNQASVGVTGVEYQAQTFDPTSYQQHINFGDVHDIRDTDKMCIGFAKTSSITTSLWIVAKSAYGSVAGRWAQLGYGSDGSYTTLVQSGSTNYQCKYTDSHNDDTWRMFVSRVDRDGDLDLIVDGAVVDSVDISSFSSSDINITADFLIGCYNDPDGVGRHDTYGAFNGEIDEVWVFSAIRSDDWLITFKNAVLSPSTFYSVGVEENPSRRIFIT